MQKRKLVVLFMVLAFAAVFSNLAFGQDIGNSILVVLGLAPNDLLDPHTVLTEEPKTYELLSEVAVNLRMEPAKGEVIGTTVANVKLTAQVFKKETVGEDAWDLVRVWRSDNGIYVGFGWAQEKLFTVTPVEAKEVKQVVMQPCARKDEGVVLTDRAKVDSYYVFDVLSSGCNEIWEGRFVPTKRHNIATLRQADQFSGLLLYGFLVFSEGTVREYPLNWNMQDATATKATIGEELANAKRYNMQHNAKTPYDWPIALIATDGTVTIVEPGKYIDGVKLPDNCSFKEPQLLTITALYTLGESFPYNASIGAQDCRTIAWGELVENPGKVTVQLWKDAMDNIVFKNITAAYMLPRDYTDDEIRSFFAAQKVTGNLVYTYDAATVFAQPKP